MTLAEVRSGEPAFTWIAEESDSTLFVRFKGELDLAVVDECAAGLDEPLMGPEASVVLDLGQLTFADSTGLRFLIDTKRRAESRGKRLLLSEVSEPMLKLFDVTGLTSWFEYADGSSPQGSPCPVCDRSMHHDGARCPHCGAVLRAPGDGAPR
jgi:anti-anti-sigma factor